MKKPILLGLSLLCIILVVLGSQTNVVGFQTVQASMKDGFKQKELVFQTIVDIVNNKEIQKVFLASQLKNIFTNFNGKFSTIKIPVLTVNQLKRMYVVGLILSKSSFRPKISLLTETFFPLKNKLNGIFEKDLKLKKEIDGLKALNCPCSTTTPIFKDAICLILLIIAVPFGIFGALLDNTIFEIFGIPFLIIAFIAVYIAEYLNCFPYPY